jgi:hypothetical protein
MDGLEQYDADMVADEERCGGKRPRATSAATKYRKGLQVGDAEAQTAASEQVVLSTSEKDAKLAQKLGQLQPFIAVFSQECTSQLAASGPT